MPELPPDDPRLDPMPDELDSGDDLVLTNCPGDVFHRVEHDDVPVCGNHGNYSPRPRNVLPHRVPCSVCFPSVYGDDSGDELTTIQERIDKYR
jgi:hypothetical protein